MKISVLLAIAIALSAGLILNRIVKLVSLPNVTGYLIAGLIIGPCMLNIFPKEALEQSSVVAEIALGFIAFSIGAEFKFSDIKKIGSSVLSITLAQAVAACLFVNIALIVMGFDLPIALTLGAIATATAPAATLMVIRQYKAKGTVTNMLLPVVALDDAIGLIIFSVSLSIAQVLEAGSKLSISAMILEPLAEISFSLLGGLAIGLILCWTMRFFKSSSNRLCVVIATVFMSTALSSTFNLSSLLFNMCVGAVLANMRNDFNEILSLNDQWTPPLFLLFFVISGAELDLKVLPSVGLLGVTYLIARSAGKYFGALFGATITHAEPNIKKYLGLTLLPQAGVAIGMSQIVITALPVYGGQIRAVVLCATLVYEFVGPLITKIALTKAGEIQAQ